MTTITIPPQQGDVILHGLMSLENRRPLPDKPNTFIYNTIFSCAESDDNGVGSFRHYIGTDKNKKQDGFYETNARIVSFKWGHNINSDEYCDEAINMQPLSVINKEDFNYKMSVSVTSVVVNQDRANATFVLHILQSPWAALLRTQLPYDVFCSKAGNGQIPPIPMTTTKTTPLKHKGKMCAKMHTQAESGVEANTCASPSTSQSVLAKRKDHPSEDEVDEDV
ncbi:hypothetical protein EI94DRAFT_1904871 [Lactarius quietus]|nr:hypothetical protein EI94DRAFT_1904871 [Lactarius quietus]